jgi:hypothetical protein
MKLGGIDRGKIDSHGRDLSKLKMPAWSRHRKSQWGGTLCDAPPRSHQQNAG